MIRELLGAFTLIAFGFLFGATFMAYLYIRL